MLRHLLVLDHTLLISERTRFKHTSPDLDALIVFSSCVILRCMGFLPTVVREFSMRVIETLPETVGSWWRLQVFHHQECQFLVAESV